MNKQLKFQIIVRLAMAFPALGALFFWPAGTFNYWEAWVYLAILFGAMITITSYFSQRDPDLLVRRMGKREREIKQQWIVGLTAVYFLQAYLLPGFDQRYGWSNVAMWVVLAADGIVVLGFVFLLQVFKANSYAARVIVVEEGQEVISTGPYALVRHPMYF
jgi:protein-S-isoprenylcysteine O-methyltransferase Ste14